jgi:AcrR family transcriptional regulator
MSELPVPGRRRRADAKRSVSAILDAATRLFGREPAASLEEVAAEAGVARQTIYAHYPTRGALLDAVLDRITADVVASLDAAEPDSGTALAALERWLDTSWGLLERYPVLLQPGLATPGGEDYQRHAPILDSLLRIIRRGQQSREFEHTRPSSWLAAATIALGHAAGQEVTAARMSIDDAGAAFRESVVRVCRAGSH